MRARRTATIRSAALLCAALTLTPPTAPAQEADREPDPPPCAAAVPHGAEPAPAPAELTRAHDLATGAGVRVAVIDTGVAPHPRLGEVIDGGDLVLPDDQGTALHDCDGHGTVVAGVLASRPGAAGQGPVGIAPDAEILSIRQSSARYRELDDSPVGTVGSLAAAIDRAVEQQAQVISISVVACVPAQTAAGLDTTTLDTALRRAEESEVVVVAAAGNLGPGCEPGAVVYPAHSPTVLAVAAFSDPHRIADYSVPAPAGQLLSASGHHPVGLSPSGEGLAAGLLGSQGTVAFEGTSFAAPVVSGTVALLRERHPDLSAAQLRELVVDSVDPVTGAVDPYRAVMHLPSGSPPAHRQIEVTARQVPEPVSAHRAQWLLVGLAATVIVSAGAAGITGMRKGRDS